jgi:hypothetical protein
VPQRGRGLAIAKRSSDGLEPDNGSSEDFVSLAHRLTVISRSLALIALRLAPSKPTSDMQRMLLLESLGLHRAEIAELLNTTAATVRAGISEVRRQSKTRTRSKSTAKKTGRRRGR